MGAMGCHKSHFTNLVYVLDNEAHELLKQVICESGCIVELTLADMNIDIDTTLQTKVEQEWNKNGILVSILVPFLFKTHSCSSWRANSNFSM